MKKPISRNQIILLVVVGIVLIMVSKNYEGTMSILDDGKKTVSYEEFKTFILEGDEICSPGERRSSIDCKTDINFDSLIGCMWKKDIQCSSKFTTAVIIGMVALFGYVMIGGQFGKKRKK